MPIIESVRLEIKEEEFKTLLATAKVRVKFTPLEACLAETCLKGLNQEYRMSVALLPMDLGVVVPATILASLGTQSVVWPVGEEVSEFTFTGHFRKGFELNEDSLPGQLDEIVPSAEIRTAAHGAFVTFKHGDPVSGYF